MKSHPARIIKPPCMLMFAIAAIEAPAARKTRVTASAALRAVAVNAAGDTEIAPNYLQVEPDLLSFSSNLPVVVLWSTADQPRTKLDDYTTFTVTVFEPPPGDRISWPRDAELSSRAGLKVRGSEIQQRITELTLEAVGEYAAPYLPGLLWQGSNEAPVGPSYAHLAAPRYFNARKTTIYGGSNEIQKGIISKMVLGL